MNKIFDRLQRAIHEKVFPGAVLGIVKTNGDRVVYPVGNFTYESDSPKVKHDTMYDLASVTKSIPGSCSILKLIDDGRLHLDDKLVSFLPEFGNLPGKEDVTVKHLLTYTLDLEVPAMSTLKNKNADEIIEIITTAPLKSPPGSKHFYSNSTAGFFTPIIENITGQTIDAFADENFFKPLGMSRTTFFPEKFDKNEIAPTEIDEWRGRVIQGEVHDESTFILRQKNYMIAAAGLFSTAPDILNFLEMLLNGGVFAGKKYFSPEIIREMHKNQTGVFAGDLGRAGLGWVINWPEGFGSNASPETFCKSGFTGTFVAIDPMNGIAFVLLSNRTYPKRPSDNSAIAAVRRDISDLCFSDR